VYELDATLAVGPMMARHIAQRMHRGEYYALQINSHVTFVQDWDVSMIEQWESTKNEMALISTVLDSNLGSVNEETGEATKTHQLKAVNFLTTFVHCFKFSIFPSCMLFLISSPS
jgi:hypothetical protein